MNNIEIEIQVKVDNCDQLMVFLKDNARYIAEERLIDDYYVPFHRDFLMSRPVDEWLRIRRKNEGALITYKKWHRDESGKSLYCDEYETNVGDMEKLQKIFEVLDFKLVVTVDKKREVWRYQDFEVAIDQVKNLGSFIEVEYKGDSGQDPEKINTQMVEFLKEAGCGRVQRNHLGYPFQILYPNEVEWEDV